MDDKVKVNFNGKIFEAKRIPVTQSRELWNEYLLDDGSRAKIKLVLTDVFRIEDLFDDDGNPVYQVKTSTVASVIAPDNLKKMPGGL